MAVPNTFVTGTRISADDVNENFEDQDDRITALEGAAVVTFSAIPADALGVVATSLAKLVFASEQWDDEAWYDTALSRFTPQAAGIYEFSGLLASADQITGGKTLYLALYKNGALEKYMDYDTAAITTGLAVAGAALASANGSTDYFELWGMTDNASPRTVGTSSYFQGRLVRGS